MKIGERRVCYNAPKKREYPYHIQDKITHEQRVVLDKIPHGLNTYPNDRQIGALSDIVRTCHYRKSLSFTETELNAYISSNPNSEIEWMKRMNHLRESKSLGGTDEMNNGVGRKIMSVLGFQPSPKEPETLYVLSSQTYLGILHKYWAEELLHEIDENRDTVSDYMRENISPSSQ